ncbi:MAG: WD40 repeat domain-containing protein [Cyanobacteria bacterium P01_A01_bin.114]
MQSISLSSWQAHLKQARYRWETQYNLDPGALLRGQPLTDALEKLAQHGDQIDGRDRNFIEASLSVAKQTAAEREAQWQYLIKTLCTCAQQKFASGQELDALLEIMQVARLINAKQQVTHVDTYTQMRVVTTLGKILDEIREYNQLSQDQQLSILAMSPDGNTLAAVGKDGVIQPWTSAGIKLTPLVGHRKKINALAFSPDGQTLASVSEDCTVKLWPIDGNNVTTFKVARPDINRLEFTLNGQTLAAFSGYDKRIYLWHIEACTEGSIEATTSTIIENDTAIRQVCFSPNSQTIAAITYNNLIKLWQLDGTPLLTLKGDKAAYCLTFSPDGQILAAAGVDHTITLWQIGVSSLSMKPIELATLTGHCAAVQALQFSPDSQTLASGSEDCTLKLWALDGSLKATLTGRQNPHVSKILFSPNSQYLLATGCQEALHLWKLDQTGYAQNTQLCFSPYRTLQKKPGRWHAQFDSESEIQRLIYQDTRHIELWHLQATQTLTIGENNTHTIAVSPDGQYIATADRHKTIKIWDRAGAKVATLKGHTQNVQHMSFSPNGQALVSVSQDNAIKLWKIDGTELSTLALPNGPINRVLFSADGQQVIAASDDGTVKRYSIDLKQLALGGIELATLEVCPHGVACVACSPNQDILVTGDYEGYLKFWQSDGTLQQTVRAHHDAITHVAFTMDGKRLASSSYDHTIKIWQPDGRELSIIRAHQDAVNTVAWHPNGNMLASASQDGTTRLWVVEGQEITTLHTCDCSCCPTVFLINADGTSSPITTSGKSTQRIAQPTTLSFTADGSILVDAFSCGKTRLWSLDLKQLFKQGESWLQNYLEHSSTAVEKDKTLLDALYPVLSQ